MVIVAPKSMVGEWQAEIRRFCGGLYKAELLDGARRERAAMLSTGADVYVGTTRASCDPRRLRAAVQAPPRLLVADESFAVKNPSAQRTGARAPSRVVRPRVRAVRHPAPNDSADVISQVTFVDFGRAFGRVQMPDDPDARRSVVKRSSRRRSSTPEISSASCCRSSLVVSTPT